MKLLFGIKGHKVGNFRNWAKENFPKLEINEDNCIIVNLNQNPIPCPSIINTANKRFLMNGTFFLRDYTIDEFIRNPKDCLSHLLSEDNDIIPEQFVNGAFNAVILDRESLIIFNDFFALDPLYYAYQDETLYFSNRLQILQQILNRPWKKNTIEEYLSLGYNYSYHTILEGIDCLPPASMLRFDGERIFLTNYSSFPKEPEITAPQKEVIEIVGDSFKNAIKRIYSPKLKYNLSLTGGMDSRLIYLQWPDRQNLLTETAGEGTSDYLKAKALVAELGNTELHKLEVRQDKLEIDGKIKFYEDCDNPLKLLSDPNYSNLLWKRNRGADFHLSGAGGGELLNGENLYLSRKPLHVIREGFLPNSYDRLDDDSKKDLVNGCLYSPYKSVIKGLLHDKQSGALEDYSQLIVEKLNGFLGNPLYKQSYIERFRTFMLANAAFYPVHVVAQDRDIPIMPFIDRTLMTTITKYHPCTRELRRLELALLKEYNLAAQIPFDTSHLKQNYPYFAHKFMRMLRMVFNIGLHKKIPLIQKGDPPKQRTFKYFDHNSEDYREYFRSVIRACTFIDHKPLDRYLEQIDKVESFNFYTHHREAANLMLLFRLAWAEKLLKNKNTTIV